MCSNNMGNKKQSKMKKKKTALKDEILFLLC